MEYVIDENLLIKNKDNVIKENKGTIDFDKFKPIIITFYEYRTTGEKIGERYQSHESYKKI